jgi:hypothetical protein
LITFSLLLFRTISKPGIEKFLKSAALNRAAEHGLKAGNVFRLKTFGALFDFEFNRLAFIERLVAIHRDRGEVHEYVFTGLALNETIAFGSIEPLHCALFLHFAFLSSVTPAEAGAN